MNEEADSLIKKITKNANVILDYDQNSQNTLLPFTLNEQFSDVMHYATYSETPPYHQDKKKRKKRSSFENSEFYLRLRYNLDTTLNCICPTLSSNLHAKSKNKLSTVLTCLFIMFALDGEYISTRMVNKITRDIKTTFSINSTSILYCMYMQIGREKK